MRASSPAPWWTPLVVGVVVAVVVVVVELVVEVELVVVELDVVVVVSTPTPMSVTEKSSPSDCDDVWLIVNADVSLPDPPPSARTCS